MPNVICFGSFQLDLESADLRKSGRSIRLPEQQFQILQMLLLAGGGVVSRDEIRRRLWPNDTIVEFDRSINAAIMKLRSVLGDSADRPRFIETVARRGYRMLIPVELEDAEPVATPASPPAQLVRSGSLVGRKLSHYRVLGVLGGGGMGLVYKAEDLKLNRPVALKFLPEELASDEPALQRFEREARLASSLNHPNICTIYQVEEHDGHPFIVMEFLEGETLRDFAARFKDAERKETRPLQVRLLVEIALHIAYGLEAAHLKGIIHRDIKPANIFITMPGQIKILDFGLAKSTAGAKEGVDPQNPPVGFSWLAADPNVSRTGMAMGTAGYMSPEQVRGEELDARTDLFSFGLILFEMATGQRAFDGDTAVIVQDEILHRPHTPARTINPNLPLRLEDIISKALQKQRELRYSNAAEIVADLKEVKAEVEGRNDQTGKPGPSARRRNASVWIGSGSVVLLLLLAIVYLVAARQGRSPFKRFFVQKAMKHEGVPLIAQQQVSFSGDAYWPAISPDGKSVAYVTDNRGMGQTLVLQDLAGGLGHELLHGATLMAPSWSPRGSEIMIPLSNGDDGGLYVISTSGGAPQLVSRGFGYSCWLPGGTNFVKGTVDSTNGGIFLIDRFTGETRRIPAPAYHWLFNLACSGKNGRLLFLAQTLDKNQIWAMNQDGTDQRILVQGTSGVALESPRWSPSEDAIYFFREERGTTDLVRLPVSGQSVAPTVLASGLQSGDNFSISADGSNIAYTRTLSYSNLWLVEVSAEPGLIPSTKQLTSETLSYSDPVFSPDGRSVAYTMGSSDSTGNVWKMAIAGGHPVQLTFADAAGTWSPAWSTDGKRIAYLTNQGGSTKVWVVGADGGDARPLEKTDASDSNNALSWSPSPDIIYLNKNLHNFQRLNVETQEAKPLFSKDFTGYLLTKPVFSPDGKKIATYWNRGSADAGASVIAMDSLLPKFLNRDTYPFGWSPDGKFLYAYRGDEGSDHREILEINLSNPQQTRSMITMPGEIIAATMSPDGQKIIVSVGEEKSDVWLMKNVDPYSSPPKN